MGYSIAYVMSLPHSGSTLAGALLGAHSQAFLLGEPWKLRQYARRERERTHKTALGNACTCGAPDIWTCTFWPRVDAAVRSVSDLGLADLDPAAPDPERFHRDNKLLFDAVAKATGASLLVDSSKRIQRCERLVASGIAPVTVLHLMRDPRGQVLSNMKRSGRGPYRHALRNQLDTWKMGALGRRVGASYVSYERIATDPVGWLTELMPRLGLEYEPSQLEWARLERHNLSGNQSRMTRDSAIRVDRSWEAGLSWPQRVYVDMAAGLVSRMTASLYSAR
ncbi:sulfotransferase [Sphingomonas sp. LY54]|uniref:sulfotransferase n=1 Tax=Sphingomonas sp. LY54 TaxID=3095343 RepID=UPI002D77C88E|nr:sulfotransferase [Sphingomonas sp. LY54]WRP28207.1 sulfotransferase [Sphingomonas sp. LY54]